MIDNELKLFLSELKVNLGITLNAEQEEFASDFLQPGMCFAGPGTGKTHASAVGLLVTELYHKVPASKIYVASFSNAAVGEIAIRHRRFCRELDIKQNINISTIHRMCTDILSEHYKRLDMPSYKTNTDYDALASRISFLEKKVARLNIAIEPNRLRNVVNAFDTLNTSLVFSRLSVEETMEFKSTSLTYEEFQTLRWKMYDYSRLSGIINVGDILLITLELLLKNPDVCEMYKEKYKVLLVDEAQDLSLLQLKLISLLSNNVTIMGDPKQRIYGFNGACQEVEEQFELYFPGCRKTSLVQSYRCKDEILDYAYERIKYNNIPEIESRGMGPGGKVIIESDMDVPGVAKKIQDEYLDNGKTFPVDYMFLFRNNDMMIPMVEELYQRHVPVRVPKYQGAHTLEYIKEMCEVIQLAISPTTLEFLKAFRYINNEMLEKYEDITQTPMYKEMKRNGCSLYDIKYHYEDDGYSINVLKKVRDLYNQRATTSALINVIYHSFKNTYIKRYGRYKRQEAKYYFNLIENLVTKKTFDAFIGDEVKKMNYTSECELNGRGVRCYTCHGGKGLEATIVYAIGMEEGIVPNASRIEEMREKQCNVSAAKSIRDERCLIYVAITRAKDEIHIVYDKQLSRLFEDYNAYATDDAVYKYNKTASLDIDSFIDFYEGRMEFLK